MKALYHARVLAVAEKYGFQDLCSRAAWEIEDCRVNGTHEDELEFLVQLYQMSTPGSALRLDLGWIYSDREPEIDKNMIRAKTIGYLWHDPVKWQLVEDASQRCPELGEDIQIIKAWCENNGEPREQDRRGQPMISAASSFMKGGTKHGRYPGWPTVPAYMAK